MGDGEREPLPLAARAAVPLIRVPAGEMIDRRRHEPSHRVAEVHCADGSCVRVTVLARARHRAGWALLIRWPDGQQDWRLHDPRYLRPVLTAPPSRCQHTVCQHTVGILTCRLRGALPPGLHGRMRKLRRTVAARRVRRTGRHAGVGDVGRAACREREGIGTCAARTGRLRLPGPSARCCCQQPDVEASLQPA